MSETKLRILSLDGGGIRGVIPATILVEIEDRLRKKTQNDEVRLADYLDMIAGTSTGGILTALYLFPDENNKMKPKYSAKEALGLYMENGHTIFPKNFLQNVEELFNEKYPRKPLEELLHQYFSDTMLSELVKPCLITSYDMRNRRGRFFNCVDAKQKGAIYDFKIKDVCRSTSAAPTYFEPAFIYSEQGSDYTLVDGGVFVNNPALCAYSEARTINFKEILEDSKPEKPTAKQMLIISIGTGTVKKPYPFDKIKNAGLIEWLPMIIDVMMSGNSETVDYHLKKMFATLSPEDEKDYYRLEPALQDASSEMDDVSEENLKKLNLAGLHFVSNNDDLLNEIVNKLITNHPA